MFNFTFSFSVPGVPNPFASAPAQEPDRDRKTPVVAPSAPMRRPHPATLPPALPLSRKRGWVPSEPEVSQAATIAASSSGYLDTPAKYRDFTITPDARVEDEVEEMVAGKWISKCGGGARGGGQARARDFGAWPARWLLVFDLDVEYLGLSPLLSPPWSVSRPRLPFLSFMCS